MSAIISITEDVLSGAVYGSMGLATGLVGSSSKILAEAVYPISLVLSTFSCVNSFVVSRAMNDLESTIVKVSPLLKFLLLGQGEGDKVSKDFAFSGKVLVALIVLEPWVERIDRLGSICLNSSKSLFGVAQDKFSRVHQKIQCGLS